MVIVNMKAIRSALVVGVVITSLVSGQGARNGTSGASQLMVPQGARYLSGGGATAIAVGIDAIFWNPAGLARAESNVSTIFSRRSYIADIGINFFGAGVKLGNFGSIAVAARSFDIGDIPVTTVFSPDGTGEKFAPSFFVVGATYSKLLTDRTSLGFNVNLVNEGFGRVNASALTFDAGVQYYNFLNISGLAIGVALKNFGGPMTYDGSALWTEAQVTGSNRQTEWYKVEAAAFDMPFVMDIGASYRLDLGAGNLDLGATFENNHFAQDEYRLMAQFSLGDLGALRFANVTSAVVKVEDDPDTEDINESVLYKDASLENIFSGISFGATLNLKQLTGVDLSIDYAFIATKFFNDNQTFALRLGF